jgi:hypothetical protein
MMVEGVKKTFVFEKGFLKDSERLFIRVLRDERNYVVSVFHAPRTLERSCPKHRARSLLLAHEERYIWCLRLLIESTLIDGSPGLNGNGRFFFNRNPIFEFIVQQCDLAHGKCADALCCRSISWNWFWGFPPDARNISHYCTTCKYVISINIIEGIGDNYVVAIIEDKASNIAAIIVVFGQREVCHRWERVPSSQIEALNRMQVSTIICSSKARCLR